MFSQTSLPATTENKPQVEAAVIHLTPDGFVPASITRPTGRFVLVVKNMIRRPLLTLNRATDAALAAPILSLRLDNPRGERNVRELLDLPVGEYALKDSTNAKYVLSISIRR